MCKSEQPCYGEESSRTPADQLRMLVWVLMVWVSLLTLCLGASITLHFTHPRSPFRNEPSHPAGTDCNLVTYDYDDHSIPPNLQFESRQSNGIKVVEDANYFIYLQVTLESHKPSMNYTFKVYRVNTTEEDIKIMEGHIYGSQTSAVFMAKGLRLPAETVLKVNCTPPAKINSSNTYFGIIKLGPSHPCVPPS